MLPPIHKLANGLPIERRGSGVGGAYFSDGSRKHELSSPSRSGYPEAQNHGLPSTSSFSAGLDRMAERMHALECENEHFREELQHIRHFYSSNQQQHETDKLSIGKIAEDLQRLASSFNNKLQADASHQQREQQKAALLFAEVTRLAHRGEGLESELRGVVDDTHRKLEAQGQHAQFLASIGSKQQQALSPNHTAEFQRQLKDVQDAMVQLRTEFDADRSARWKNDAAVDAKLDAQLERITSKLVADKRELARALDEQRQIVTGSDFQRVTAQMREFSRVHDHLLALERWLHGEFGQVKRVFQALAGDVDARFHCVLEELANGLKMWHAAHARQEDEVMQRFQDLEEATLAVAHTVQRKLRTLEEVIPLEVQARQKNDDKLRSRVEGVVKALGHAIETSRGEYLPQQSALAQRLHQLELAQRSASDAVSLQHGAMRETIQAFMEDSDSMLVRLAAAVEQERVKGIELLTAREAAPPEVSTHASEELKMEIQWLKEQLLQVQTSMTSHALHATRVAAPAVAPAIAPAPVTEDMKAETKLVKEEVTALQAWTTMHAQECRQFFDFLSWSVDDARRESAVVQCLDAVIDQIVETRTCEHVDTLSNGVNGALRQLQAARTGATSTRPRALTPATPSAAGEPQVDPARASRYSLQLSDQGHLPTAERSPEADALDLSTTTDYASTDGDVREQMHQADGNVGDGEEQAIGHVKGSPVSSSFMYENAFEVPSRGHLDPRGVEGLSALDDEGHEANDDGEEEYSMDVTQDEEIKPDQRSIAAVHQGGQDGDSSPTDALASEQGDELSPVTASPKASVAPDEEEPTTLDL